MLHPDDWQTIEAALNTARHEAEHEDIYGYPEKVAAIDTTLARVRALAAQGSWQPVSQLVNDQDTLHADEIAISIGTNDVCMGLFEWPEDGNEYAVCKWIPSDAMNFRHLYDAILNAHGMATGIYIQSDAEMRQRIGHFLGDIIRKCGEAMENPNSQWVAAQDATPAPPQVDHSIRVCNNTEACGWIGYNCDTVYLDGVEPLRSLCPKCRETTEELTPGWVRELQPAPPQGELPAPDWASAPEWAMYHLYNCMGSGLWVNAKHEVDTTWYSGWRSLLRQPMDKIADYSGYQLPIGTDWRATLQPRPALDAGGA